MYTISYFFYSTKYVPHYVTNNICTTGVQTQHDLK